jgi:uncharacterized protein (DUF1684 family)
MVKLYRQLRDTLAFTLATMVVASCSSEEWPVLEPVDANDFAANHQEWRENRREGLVRPFSGVVLWMGLWNLAQGATPFGSDPDLPITLPESDSPPLAGILHRSGQEITIEPAPNTEISLREGETIDGETILNNDRSGSTTNLSLGTLGMRIHGEPGTDRLWLRVWDEDSPKRETFQLPESFPVDTNWRIAARFEPYGESRALPVADVKEGILEYQTPGELVFQVNGETHRLIAVANANSTSFHVMLWDPTAIEETYQLGRYLSVPIPQEENWTIEEEGWTIMDFNRTRNPPCVFSAFSVCALPPRENRLAIPITAGEKRPTEAAY